VPAPHFSARTCGCNHNHLRVVARLAVHMTKRKLDGGEEAVLQAEKTRDEARAAATAVGPQGFAPIWVVPLNRDQPVRPACTR